MNAAGAGRGLPLRRPAEGPGGRDLLRLAQEALAERFARAEAARGPELVRLVAEWRRGALDGATAAAALLQLLGQE